MVTHQRIIENFLVVFLLFLNYDGIRGTKLSEPKDLELEKQLKLINKPPIKTIKTEYGDIYDCVNFYDQPAFHHPLLKNHKYHPQVKPSLFKKESASTSDTLQLMKLSEEGCPVGTVPIRRYTKEDLIRQKLLPPPEDNTRDNFFDTKDRRKKSLKGYMRAVITTEDNPNNKFSGASMVAAIYNPRSVRQQHSACRLKLIKGKNIIQTGWRVDPTLYGDSKTRLFIHFDDGTNSCFDLLCPSFVITSTQVTLGQPFPQISKIHGKRFDWAFQIKWDQENGNWWLFLEESGKNLTTIGFWPKEVFDEFDNFARKVEWGGVVYSPPGILEPPMGTGFYPILKNAIVNAYCKNITLLNYKGEYINLLNYNLSTVLTNSILYNIINVPNFGIDYNYTIFYGGPGEW